MAPSPAAAQFAVTFSLTASDTAGGYGQATEGGSVAVQVNPFTDTSGGQPTEDVTATCTPQSASGLTAGDFRDSADATTPSATIPTATVTWTVAELGGSSSLLQSKRCIFYTYDDALVEGGERFAASLSVSGAGATVFGGVGAQTGNMRILDNDANAITISLTAGADAVDESVASVTFTVTAQGAATVAAIQVPFTVSGDATRGTGITASPVSIPMGAQNAARTATITVPIDETDTLIDDMETVTVMLGALPTVAGLTVRAGATSATTTVNDDGDDGDADESDRDFAISANPATASEGDTVAFTVSLTGTAPAAGNPATVDWAVSGAGITAADYEITGADTDGTLSFTALGDQTLTVRLIEDLAAEGMETLTITLSNTTGGGGNGNRITTATASVTIAANTLARRLTLTGPATVGEGTDATYTVSLQGTPFANPTAITWTVTHGDTDANDLAATTGSIMFPTATTFAIGIVDDDADNPGEMAERFTVTLTAPDTASEITGGGVTTTIAATARDFAISANPATASEGDTVEFTVSLTGEAPVAGNPATVDWAVSGAGITAADYEITGADTDGTLSFTALGDQTLTVRLLEDLAAEGMETLTITLSNTTGGGGNGNRITTESADVTIAANTLARRLTLTGPATVGEGTDATYTVSLQGTPFANPTAITWTVTHGDTIAADLAATTGSIMFPTMTTFAIGIVDDDADNPGEMAERFTVTLTAPDTASEITGSGVTTTIAAQASGDDATHELLLPEVTRAVAGEVFGAIAERAGGVGGQLDGGAGFSLNGQSNWSDIAAGAVATADIDSKELLRGLQFALPVSAGAAHGKHGYGANLAFWGGGDYRGFDGEDGDDDWDGSVFSMRFGVDGQVRDNLRAGVMLSYSDAETEYTMVADGNASKGDYELDLTSVSPYLRWNLGGGHAWASVSYGSGEVEVKPDSDDASTHDVTMTGAAFGGERKLLEQNGRELSVRADAFVANSEVEGDGDSNTAGIDDDLDADANRVRVALAWAYPGRFADGRLAPAFDLGLRHDGGDGRTGTGLELGGALRFHAADVGLTLEGNARALIGHSGDHRGWGIGGLMRVQNGADGQGLAVSVAPGYGDATADPGALWEAGLPIRAGQAAARLHAEVGYGVPASMTGRVFGFGGAGAVLFSTGMLTPYSALRVGDANRDYRLGLRWKAARLDLDVFARHADGNAADNALAIEGRVRF